MSDVSNFALLVSSGLTVIALVPVVRTMANSQGSSVDAEGADPLLNVTASLES